jgi:hypothetical protein
MSGVARARTILRWLLAAIYLFAGVLHVATPHAFLMIVPGWVPFPHEVVLVTGLAYGRNTLGWGYHGPRLLFQPVIIWWTLFAGGVIDWPMSAWARPA